MNADEYDYQADDLKKVAVPGGDEHEYEPEDEDLPIEEWANRKKDPHTTFKGKSGISGNFIAPVKLSVPLQDSEGNALPDKPYRLTFPSGKVLRGITDDKGIITEYITEPGELTLELEDGSELTIETE